MIGVPPPGKLRIETHAQFENGGDAAVDAHRSFGRTQGAGNQLQQRALFCAVLSDDTDRLARLNAEVNMTERPALLDRLHRGAKPGERPPPFAAETPVGLAQVLHAQDRLTHNVSTISGAALRKRNKANIKDTIANIAVPVNGAHFGSLPNTEIF